MELLLFGRMSISIRLFEDYRCIFLFSGICVSVKGCVISFVREDKSPVITFFKREI